MYHAIKRLYPSIKDTEFILQDNLDGEGVFISYWDYAEPKPTKAQLAQVSNIPPKVFIALSAWQVRKVLTLLGMRAQVEAAVATAPAATKDAWQFANEFQRNDPLLNNMAALLGLPSEQLDSMFEIGVTL